MSLPPISLDDNNDDNDDDEQLFNNVNFNTNTSNNTVYCNS